MSQEVPGNPSPDPQGGFQQVDADAVCEQCGTVNDEGTLLCKECGQNLRDQRARRLANAAAGPEVLEGGPSRTRILTGVLSVVGILIVLLAVVNIGNIEAVLVDALSEQESVGDVRLWTGTDVPLYDELHDSLASAPATNFQIENALEEPVTEDTFNGRYVLVDPSNISPSGVIGEAELRRRGTRVYFVALLTQPRMELRGFAQLETVAGTNEFRPFVRETAGFKTDNGGQVLGFGLANPLEGGGHQVLAFESSDGAGSRQEVYAFRIR